MAKFNMRSPAVVLGVGFLIVWYVVSNQTPTYYEHLTGAPVLADEDKKAVNNYLRETMNAGKPQDIKLTSKAKDFLKFLEDHPINSIDDAFVTKIMELETKANGGAALAGDKLNEKKGQMKKEYRAMASFFVLTKFIWGYADAYEKAEKTPSRAEFDKDMLKIAKNEPTLNHLMNESRYAGSRADYLQQEIDRIDKRGPDQWETMMAKWQNTTPEEQKNNTKKWYAQSLARTQITTTTAGVDEFPFPSGSSPIISQLLDTTYIYYFPQMSPNAGAFWKSLVAFIAAFGSIIVGVIVLYLVYSYVISPMLNRPAAAPAV
jgi:hypothetical protein